MSLRAPFVCYAALLGVAAAVGHRAAADRRPGTGGPASRPRLLRHPTFRAALVANLLQGWAVYGVRLALVPLYVVEVLHRSSVWAGAALAALAVGTVAGLPLGGRWADRHGRRSPVLAGSALVAVTAMWLGHTSAPAELIIVAVLSGVGTGSTTRPVNAAVSDLLRRAAARRRPGRAPRGLPDGG